MCRHYRLASGSVGRVEYCTCGKVHLHVGRISLHLSPRELKELTETLLAGSEAIERTPHVGLTQRQIGID